MRLGESGCGLVVAVYECAKLFMHRKINLKPFYWEVLKTT